MSSERERRSQRRVMRLGTWNAAMALGVVLASSCYNPVTADRRAITEAAPHWLAATGTAFTVELVDTLDSNVSEAPFDAVVVGPILAADGSTIVKSGAVVAGRATGVPGPSGGLRLEFDSIETIRGMTRLFATVAPRQRDPSVAATDVAGPGFGYDAMLGQPPATFFPAERPSSAIGGGPREEPIGPAPQPPPAKPLEPEPSAEPSRGPPIHLRAGARLDLMLMQPLAAAQTTD